VQNFKAWSPEMVPDPSLSCYGLEYFCFEGDNLWNSTEYHESATDAPNGSRMVPTRVTSAT
jgi:hypothetical protein